MWLTVNGITLSDSRHVLSFHLDKMEVDVLDPWEYLTKLFVTSLALRTFDWDVVGSLRYKSSLQVHYKVFSLRNTTEIDTYFMVASQGSFPELLTAVPPFTNMV